MSSLNYRYPAQYQQPGIASPAPPNMSSQRFCLRWNNHQSNLLSVFDQLLHDESFVDVTLAVEGQLLRAHKMVLSACSPYFQALFVNHPDKHPIVILKDVPYSDMRSLLDFMYRGEVSVDQDRLTAFLRVAESLRIKGLTEVNEEKCDTIASSLSQQNQLNNIPQLQRLPQGNKRIVNPLLGNALLQPKRKRGRPRKLSGCSNGTPGEDFDRGDSLVQGSPEMLEVKMGMDGFTGNNSDSSNGRQDEKDSELEDGRDNQEPIAGTSKEVNAITSKMENENMTSEEPYDYPENNQNQTNLPASLTVELVPALKPQGTVIISTEAARSMLHDPAADTPPLPPAHDDAAVAVTAGVHFLTDDDGAKGGADQAAGGDSYERKKHELLEYLTRHDGSVVCKLCGEVLASRTHWYRHKYKLHVSGLINPAPLFKCAHCNVFFKSRKGYAGHVAARHADATATTVAEHQEEATVTIKEEVVETTTTTTATAVAGSGDGARPTRRREAKTADWEEQRVKEEKLVADIIDRVRKECEAQGAAVSRRGYSRRSTVMNSCN